MKLIFAMVVLVVACTVCAQRIEPIPGPFKKTEWEKATPSTRLAKTLLEGEKVRIYHHEPKNGSKESWGLRIRYRYPMDVEVVVLDKDNKESNTWRIPAQAIPIIPTKDGYFSVEFDTPYRNDYIIRIRVMDGEGNSAGPINFPSSVTIND